MLLGWLASTLALAGPDVVLMGDAHTSNNELDVALREVLDTVGAARSTEAVRLLTGPERSLAEHELSLMEGKTDYLAAFAAPRSHLVLAERHKLLTLGPSDPLAVGSADAAAFLHQSGQRVGAATVLIVPWAPLDAGFEANQDLITARVLELSADLDATRPVAIAPVGEAFRAVYQRARDDFSDPLAAEGPFAALYQRDGSLPSFQGTWLSTAVLAATLTGRPPRGTMAGTSLAERELLSRVAERLVLDDPFGSWQPPWASTWDEWGAAHDPSTVSGTWDTPLVRIASDVGGASELMVGRSTDEGPGEGRLLLWEGGALTLGLLVLGSGQEARGELILRGGRLQVRRLVLGLDPDSLGNVILVGGILSVEVLEVGEGTARLDLEEGRLEGLLHSQVSLRVAAVLAPGPAATITGDLQLRGGRLELTANGPLDVAGLASLEGFVAVPADATPGDELLVADVLEVNDMSVEGGRLKVMGRPDGRLALVVEEVDAGDQPLDSTIDNPTCGCAQGTSGYGPAAMLLLIGLVRRRVSGLPRPESRPSSAA